MAPIPIILLTGYLGAGKTTLLNRLLALPSLEARDLALIINEFGQVGMDAEQVDSGQRPVFELNKGSLFCICIKTDFIKTLRAIAEEVRPELLLVEATGVAEPRDLVDFVSVPELRDRFRIQANVCLVDAASFIRMAPMMRAARAQVQWADGLVINKTDLVSAGELRQLEAVLDEINPNAPRLRTSFGALPADWLDSLRHLPRRGATIQELPDPVFAETFATDATVDHEQFRALIEALGDDLLRLKGRIDFGDGAMQVEVAGGRYTEAPAKSPRRDPRTTFVAIGWHRRQADFRALFEATWQD